MLKGGTIAAATINTNSSRKIINHHLEDLEPMRELLHDELIKRMIIKEKQPLLKKEDRLPKLPKNQINQNSTPDDVKQFLVAKEFSQK